MRVVKFQELALMPKGTIFCEWEPCIASHWYVKDESGKFGPGEGDWMFFELRLAPACEGYNSDRPKLPNGWSKRLECDAGEDQLYAVLEDDERLFMIHMLTLVNA
jgi:hypothetical protein